ncbi:MAG: bifunctional diaminohydroxyphosphoribosylaminopyrimidine deaminase/5-amino-6-(5-phosphoribosylamino)uracil reductase RibD [Gemmataceae bacterium]
MDAAIDYSHHMRRALALARQGQGSVEPNPMVGAVVLNADSVVVGEGYHERFGGPHAEVHALARAGDAAVGGTLIVTLEPCCHFGKTPPCSDAVIRAGVRRVVVGMADPFPKVAGGGIAALTAAGIEVVSGVCQSECERLNAPYLKLLRSGRPWVIQKWAMSLDGKIATRTRDSKWISSIASRKWVHDLRGRVDAVIVGAQTVRSDDPLLTARPPGPRVPTRVVVTSSGNLPGECQLLRTARESPLLIASNQANAAALEPWKDAGAEVLAIAKLDDLFAELGQRRMTNVLVEGGAKLHGSIRDAGLADELVAFVAPIIVGGESAAGPVAGDGAETIADSLKLKDVEVTTIGGDVMVRGMY